MEEGSLNGGGGTGDGRRQHEELKDERRREGGDGRNKDTAQPAAVTDER